MIKSSPIQNVKTSQKPTPTELPLPSSNRPKQREQSGEMEYQSLTSSLAAGQSTGSRPDHRCLVRFGRGRNGANERRGRTTKAKGPRQFRLLFHWSGHSPLLQAGPANQMPMSPCLSTSAVQHGKTTDENHHRELSALF